MSRISEYMKKEQLMKQLRDELQQLEADQELKKELDFKHKLEDLMAENSKTPKEIVELLDPLGDIRGINTDEQQSNNKTQRQRAKRTLKIYVHPETGERIETRGGNTKALKEWKESGYTKEEIEDFRVDDEYLALKSSHNEDNQKTEEQA